MKIVRNRPVAATEGKAGTITRPRIVRKPTAASDATADGSPARYVPLDKRRKGWPILADGTPDTMYRVQGLRVTSFATDIGDGTILGWDMCGRCVHHIRRCHCDCVTPPNYVVYCYRSRRGLPPADGNHNGGYIGLAHDPDTGKGKLFIESPVNRARREANEDAPLPKRRTVVVKRSTPKDDVPAPVRRIIRRRPGGVK